MARTTSSDDENQELTGLYSAVGCRIKELRLALDITQEELSDRSGVSRRYIVQIERAGLNLTLEILHQLAKGLGVAIQDLINIPTLSQTDEDPKLRQQRHQFRTMLASIESFVRQQALHLDPEPAKSEKRKGAVVSTHGHS